MSVRARQRYLCLDCNNAEIIECTKEEHKEELECPRCKGKLVDVWNIGKYLPKYLNKVAEPTISLNRIESEGDLGIYAPIRVAGINVKEAPLLQIELENINSVPRVFYKGEEIKYKMEVAFEWGTGTPETYTPAYIRIKHWDREEDKRINSKTIQHNEQMF